MTQGEAPEPREILNAEPGRLHLLLPPPLGPAVLEPHLEGRNNAMNLREDAQANIFPAVERYSITRIP